MNKLPATESILGVLTNVLTQASLIEAVDTDIQSNTKRRLVAINPEKIIKCRKDPKLKAMLNTFDYRIADGIGIILASRLHRGQIKERITGIDTMASLCQLADEKGYGIFMYGSAESVLVQAKMKLIETYPHLKICGIMDGYQPDQSAIIKGINETKPDILFVALGSPKQEYWINDHYEGLNAKIFMGVGGSFDVLSEKINRAPERYRKAGLEWFYRLLKEPKRIFRQSSLLVFALLALTHWGSHYEK